MIDLANTNHTGRELSLMLSGRKPLSMFYCELGDLPDEEIIPETTFAPYVTNGIFVRGEIIIEAGFHPTLGRNVAIKYVFFALSSEAWRINSILLLKKSYSKTWQWNETLERILSSLLGYTDEEIDAWCLANKTDQKNA